MSPEDLLKDALSETGITLNVSKDALLRYVAERGAHLATLSADPGFARALRAERNAVALYAGLNASLQAEAVESRIVGVISGVLLGLAS